jgi:hypothetical protein
MWPCVLLGVHHQVVLREGGVPFMPHARPITAASVYLPFCILIWLDPILH